MRHLLLAITAIILTALPAASADLLILQSGHQQVYEQAVRLLQNNCAVKADPLVMSDYAEFDLGRIVREEQPRMVIAIGEQAFAEARKLRRIPVVFSLALNVHENALGNNIAGISMHVAPDNYLKLFKKLHLQRIGIIYDPVHSSAWLKRARKSAAGSGIELVALKVSSPREVPAALLQMKERAVDALWMIPDSTAVAAETIDAYFLFAQKQNLPVISFAKGYLTKGALVALEGTPAAAIEKSCATIRKLQDGTSPAELSVSDIDKPVLHTNMDVAARLNVNLSELRQQLHPERE